MNSYTDALQGMPKVTMPKLPERRSAFSRDDRMRMVLLAFMVKIQSGKGREMTVAEIAKCLHVSPSTHLRNIVKELEVRGLLENRREDYPGAAGFRVLWSLKDRKLAQQATRTIKITHHRKTEQIPLFSEE